MPKCDSPLFFLSDRPRGETDYHIGVIGLNLCFVCRLVSYNCAAPVTAVNYDIAALGVGLCLNRAEYSAAGVCSVAGIYVNVQRTEAEWAMITRGVSERKHLLVAVFTYKAGIVLGKSLSGVRYYFVHFIDPFCACLRRIIFPLAVNNISTLIGRSDMKRILAILGVVIVCMLLGISVEWARESDITLVSASPAAIAGERE